MTEYLGGGSGSFPSLSMHQTTGYPRATIYTSWSAAIVIALLDLEVDVTEIAPFGARLYVRRHFLPGSFLIRLISAIRIADSGHDIKRSIMSTVGNPS
jgi:hypothetical protein